MQDSVGILKDVVSTLKSGNNSHRRATGSYETNYADLNFTTGIRSNIKSATKKSNIMHIIKNGNKKRHLKLPKLRFAEALSKQERKQGERRLLNPSQCVQPCDHNDSDDVDCQCNILFDCAGNLTIYDLSMLVLGGYVSWNSIQLLLVDHSQAIFTLDSLILFIGRR